MKASWIAAACIAFTLGCSKTDDPAGPIDGQWLVTELTCDGATQPIGEFVLNVNNTSGTFVQGFGPGCVITLEESYSYPDAQTFGITPQTITCDPNTDCASIFGADCLPLPPPVEFGYTRNGSTLTFTQTASAPTDPCPAGQAVEFTLEKQ